MPKLENVQEADHLITLNNQARGREVFFRVKELLPGTDDLIVEQLGEYLHRHVVLNWTGSYYRNPANGEEYDLQINPANALMRAYAERMEQSASSGPMLV